jgi:hypothetical protein
MAKISATKKIALEEFPNEARGWISKLVNPVNKFFEQSYFALSKGLTIADNLKAQRFDLDIAVNQVWPMRLTWTLNERPTMLLLGYIRESRGEAIGAHSMEWSYDNGNIEVTLTGLNAAYSYTATLVGQV